MPKVRGTAFRTGIALGIGLALWATTATAETIHLVTESYPPFAYEQNGVIEGVSTDILKAVMADAGLDYDISVRPWARAYALASTEKDHCVFSTVHTTERDAKFAWVEPLFLGEAYLVRKIGTPVTPATLEEARPFRIGSQLGDYTVDILKARGFTRVDLAPEIDLTVKKLLAGRIDMMPMAASMITEERRKGVPIEPVVMLVANINALACNPDTPHEAVERMRHSLRKINTDGTRDAIFAHYDFHEGPIQP